MTLEICAVFSEEIDMSFNMVDRKNRTPKCSIFE